MLVVGYHVLLHFCSNGDIRLVTFKVIFDMFTSWSGNTGITFTGTIWSNLFCIVFDTV